jgi:hypothetical protein
MDSMCDMLVYTVVVRKCKLMKTLQRHGPSWRHNIQIRIQL